MPEINHNSPTIAPPDWVQQKYPAIVGILEEFGVDSFVLGLNKQGHVQICIRDGHKATIQLDDKSEIIFAGKSVLKNLTIIGNVDHAG